MVVLGVSLRFWQESKAETAAAKLKAMISVTATVVRDGAAREVPLTQLVPGDVVKLAAGDMIPADLRLLTCKDLFLTQASLTGESFPVEKFDAPEPADDRAPLERKNICFLGTSVESGTALGLVAATGPSTYLGGMATRHRRPTSANQLRQGHQPIHLADDRLHGRDDAVGVFHQRFLEAGLVERVSVRRLGGGGADARDAADDRHGLPLQRGDRHVEEEGDRQAAPLDPELRGDGRALHRQDRHADDGPGDPRAALRRGSRG